MSDLATPTSQALSSLTDEERAMLDADRNKSGSSLPTIPQIKLANKDETRAPEGHYFIETYKGKDQEPEIRVLGPNPVVTILYKAATYSRYTKEDGLIVWTSDIHGFTSLDLVTLYVKKDGQAVIDKEGPYPEIKNYINEKFVSTDPVTGKKKKLLKFQTVLYVLFEGTVHKLFVSNASNAGVDHEGLPSFDAPQHDSLQLFTDRCWTDKRATYEFSVRLDSLLITSNDKEPSIKKKIAKVEKPFYIMTFTDVVELDAVALKQALHASKNTERAIIAIDEARRNSVTKDQRVSTEAEVVDPSKAFAPEIEYKPSVAVEDLPF